MTVSHHQQAGIGDAPHPLLVITSKRWILVGVAIVFALLQGTLLGRYVKDDTAVSSSSSFRDAEEEEFSPAKEVTATATATAIESNNDDNSKSARLDLEVNPRFEVVIENPLSCTSLATNSEECCASWDINADDYWLHAPDWEVARETATTYCLGRIQNPEKAEFLRQVHDQQWTNADCTKVETSVQMNSGFGACTRWLLFSFWHAHLAGNSFQIEWGRKRRWLYATGDESSWAYCLSEDITCYYLPISPCSRNVTESGQHHETSRPNKTDANEMQRFFWLQDYMTRPRHNFRRKQYELRSQLSVTYPCTTMHVRRGDAGMPRPPYRRYAAVQEYIDAAKLQKGDNIVLLTDDESTIEEVRTYHQDDYNFIYSERPRNRGVQGGFDGHIPSGDEGFEMLAIATELRVAATCETIVCGQSGFMESLVQSMDAEGRNYTLHFLDTRVSKQEALKFGFKNNKREKGLLGAVEATIKEHQGEGT